MAYYFTADKLSVGYQGVPLIENIKINLNRGEILTLIGPNGAGKSTILKSIAGQLKPLGGCILLEGENLKQLSGNELARKMAVMLTKMQKTELMTCEEVVSAGRYPYTGRFGILSKEDHEKVREAMELVQAAELAKLDFQKVSDGQRQRILLARAICQEPELILLDEPTSYLDIRYKLEFLSVLQEMTRKKKVTVILSLHELELAEKISDRILCIKEHCGQDRQTTGGLYTRIFIRALWHDKGKLPGNQCKHGASCTGRHSKDLCDRRRGQRAGSIPEASERRNGLYDRHVV